MFQRELPWGWYKSNCVVKCYEYFSSIFTACDCGGFSNECYFDEELYRTTGHGGHCINCADNRGGVNCQECLPNHYVDARTNRCTPCSCDATGK